MRVRFLVFTLILSLVIPQFAAGQSPVVSSSELRRATTAATETRQKNRDTVRNFFSSERVRAALKSGRVDYQRVDKAIASLSAEELDRLAVKTSQIQQDFAGGALTNEQLTYIAIALAAAVIVLILVKA